MRFAERINLARATPWAILGIGALMEVLWIYPWFAWISHWSAFSWVRPPLPLVGAVILAEAGTIVSYALLRSRLPVEQVRFYALVILAVVLATTVRVSVGGGYGLFDSAWGNYANVHLSEVFGILALGAFLFWRGIANAQSDLDFDAYYRRFQFGVAALVVLLVAWGIGARVASFNSALGVQGLYAISYFLTGLSALALINLQSLRQEMLSREGVSNLLNRRWISLVLGVIVTLVVVGVGVASIFSFNLARLVFHPLGVFFNWIFIGFVYAVGIPLGFVAELLIYALRWALHPSGHHKLQMSVAPGLQQLKQAAQNQPSHVPVWLGLLLKWGIIALIVLVVIAVLAYALFRYEKSKSEDEAEEENESLWTWEGFKADLKSFLARILRFFWRQRQRVSEGPPPVAVREFGRRAERLFTVREIYQGVLWEARHAGIPRRQGETPYEYRESLNRSLLNSDSAVAEITEAYVATRYGEASTDQERLTLLNRLWRQLRDAIRTRGTGGSETPTSTS